VNRSTEQRIADILQAIDRCRRYVDALDSDDPELIDMAEDARVRPDPRASAGIPEGALVVSIGMASPRGGQHSRGLSPSWSCRTSSRSGRQSRSGWKNALVRSACVRSAWS